MANRHHPREPGTIAPAVPLTWNLGGFANEAGEAHCAVCGKLTPIETMYFNRLRPDIDAMCKACALACEVGPQSVGGVLWVR
jgi:hypothetical protein